MGLIKFRVWHKDGKVMLSNYLGFIITDGGQLLIESMLGDEATMEKVELDNYTVMQSTGLKDKNGTKIFEGDIVRWTRLSRSFDLETYETRTDDLEVIWCDYNAGFLAQDGTLLYYEDSEQYEVIGNIHENPELLEDK